jgi:hypothetical protein
MSDLLIKPLRSYEDRGTIRNIDNEPYAAPVWLAKELEQLKLCEIVGEVDGEKNKSEGAGQGYKLQKKGQKVLRSVISSASEMRRKPRFPG